MADRAQASMTYMRQTRGHKILALVPKTGAGSGAENSESSGDELTFGRRCSYSSSEPRSIASSLENLHLLSDEEEEIEISDRTEPSHQIPMSVIETSCDSPSILNTYTIPFSPSPSTRARSIPSSIPTAYDSTLSPKFQNPDAQPLTPLTALSYTKKQLQTSTRPPTNSDDQIPPTSPLVTAAAKKKTFFNKILSPSPSPSPSSPLPGINPNGSVTSPLTRSKKAPKLVVTKKVIKLKKLEANWTCKKFLGKADIEDKTFDGLPPDNNISPLGYFKLFLTDDLIELMVEQTNLYHMQIKGTSLNVTADEIKDFVAINILMGVVSLPAYTDYWSQGLRYDKIANIMPLKRFQQLRRFLHFSDNLKDDGDRYYKIRPFLETIRQNCLKVEEENRFSIDEMMVPYKGTRAGTRKQYIKNKPRKWGFKVFVRAGISGIVYDFLVYGGEDTFRYHEFSEHEESMGLGAKVVLALAKTIQRQATCVLYFDNYFTSLELIHHLRHEYGIFSLGTIRQNRLRGAEAKLPTDKNLKKRGRGAHAQVVCNKSKLVVVKWFDNKCVTAASSYVDAEPVDRVMRYNKETKNRGPVPCPNIIRHYNAHMGGVDLADMLVALYRTEMRAHRWYIPLFSQLLDICVNNAWLIYRRQTKDKKVLKLKDFRCAISNGLVTSGRVVEKAKNSRGVKLITPTTGEESRFDQVGHMPSFMNKGRCKLCIKHQTKLYCLKCNVRLCLVEDRNCFQDYHTK